MEKTLRIAKELSNLIIYCRAMPFSPESKYFNASLVYVHKREKLLFPNWIRKMDDILLEYSSVM